MLLFLTIYESLHDTLVLITYARKPSLNSHAGIFSRTRSLNVGSSLHSHPYVVYASRESSCESVKLYMLAKLLLLDNAISNKLSCAG